MTRPESAVEQFARELRELRREAGSPSYRSMQDRGYVSYSSLCRAALGYRLPTWPVVHGFVTACGGDLGEWKARWQAARAATRSLPDAAGVETVPQLRCAVHDILSQHDVGVVSTMMREPLSTVRKLGRRPDVADPVLFERFLKACGATDDEVREWTQAWRQIVANEAERAGAAPVGIAPPDVAPANVAPANVAPANVAQASAELADAEEVDRDQPAPDGLGDVADYDTLLAKLRDLCAARGVSCGDIELSTGGRLTADDAGAILGGARPASGEEFVLLLRALGVRAGVDRWVDSWARVSGSVAGRQQQPGGVRLRLRRMVHALMVVGLS